MRIRLERDSEDDSWYPVDSTVDIIYANTPTSSPARKLLVDMWSDRGHAGWITEFPSKLPREFLEDLTITVFNRRTRPEAIDRVVRLQDAGGSCVYHKHEDIEKCHM